LKKEGFVKWFSDEEGFGWIEVEGMKDVFVHFSDILQKGYKVLYEGDFVEFEIVKKCNRDSAVNVKKIINY
jgi:CspA family cold shock protein